MVRLVDRESHRVDIRYHLDEHIDSAVAAGLRLRGVDVTTTIEQGLDGASDSRQMEFARGQGRVLVTCDSDFLALANSGVPHAGIVFWASSSGQRDIDGSGRLSSIWSFSRGL